MLLIIVSSIHQIIKMVMRSSLLKKGKALLLSIISAIIFLCFTHNILAQPYDAIINLGGDCQVAYQLYIHGIRKYALPFDTLIIPYDALYRMLANNFDGFMEPENFAFMINEKNEKYILDQKYGSRLIHDFKLEEEFLKGFDDIAAQYLRRIERLRQFIATSEYPLFIRKRIAKAQALELRDLLSYLRNNRPFMLAALDDAEDMASNWQLEHVRNFYLRQPQAYTWKGDSEAWKEIFLALDLTLSDSTQSSKDY